MTPKQRDDFEKLHSWLQRHANRPLIDCYKFMSDFELLYSINAYLKYFDLIEFTPYEMTAYLEKN